jgi:hypothetical protein
LTDGYVVAFLYGTTSGCNSYLQAYTDASATPTQLIAVAMIHYDTTGGNTTLIQYDSLTMPVRSGDYYRVDLTNLQPQGATTTVNFIPFQ